MHSSIRVRYLLANATWLATVSGCGGGPSVQPVAVPASIEVRVSAGAPVSNATVTVYAVSDATGQVNNSVGAGGVLASGGPTDSAGKVVLSVRPYSGPIQVVAGGPAMSYPDPTSPSDGSGVGPVIQVPAAFQFTSYVAKFKQGAPVPVTLFTTLADHAALAYARGLHFTHPSKTTISEALAVRDPLFVTHITNTAAAWDPGSLRWTTPAPLTLGPQTLVDSAFAAIFDVALNQLARDTAVKAGYSSDPGALTAPTLLQLLEDDIDADGRLDGLTFGGRTVATSGATPVVMDARFLRRPLAIALAAWSRNTSVNRSGISDADLASAQVFKTINEDNSDLFGSAPTIPFDPLDRTPPELSFAAQPPAFSGAQNMRLSLGARDESGLKAVYAQVGATRSTANLVDGTWQVDLVLQAVGHNAITIWAEDAAEPSANSGLGRGQPYEFDLDVVYDPDPPQAVYDSSYASYADERSLTVQAGADGLALVPASYGAAPRGAVPNGGEIFKAATRLAAGGPLDAAELDSTNVGNIPVLRFAVPFNDKVDAPITRAAYTVTVTCPSCGAVPPARGHLLASPTPGVQAVNYELPLSAETVPALATATGPVALNVTLDLADAAGNVSTVGGFNYTFHVIGPPVAVVEDTAYSGYGDPRSTFPYRIRGLVTGVDSYATLFDPSSPAFYAGEVRLARFIISNPSPDPLAIRVAYAQSPTGSWKVTESWGRQSWADQPTEFPRNGPSTTTPRSIDGFTFFQSTYWATPYGSLGGRLAKTETGAHPCGGRANGTPGHKMGDALTRWTCLPDSIWGAVTTDVFASGPVLPAVFRGPQQGGGEVLAPETDASGTAFIVPGAMGAAPGTLVVYVTRPVGAGRSRPLRMNLIGNMNVYETYDYEAAIFYETWSTFTPLGTATYDTYVLFKTGEYLQAGSESLEGGLEVTTQGLAGASLVGEPAAATTNTLSRTIATH